MPGSYQYKWVIRNFAAIPILLINQDRVAELNAGITLHGVLIGRGYMRKVFGSLIGISVQVVSPLSRQSHSKDSLFRVSDSKQSAESTSHYSRAGFYEQSIRD